MSQIYGPITLEDFKHRIYPAVAIILHKLRQRPIDLETLDLAKIEGALNAPFAGFGGHEQYPGISRKAAAYLYLVAKSHSLLDGNKRMAVVTCIYFLFMNGWWLNVEAVELYSFTKKIVASKRKAPFNIARTERFIGANLQPLEEHLKESGLI
jgi:prophage maintenance system killer protein